MASNKESAVLGRTGEDVAADYLASLGYSIVERNWRKHHWEVDIICQDGSCLCFVEVKTRTREVEARDLLSDHKIECLYDAADAYVDESGHRGDVRLDLIVLTLAADAQQPNVREGFEVEYIKNAFQ